MPNTTLPTNVTNGSTGRIAQTNIVHAEINSLTRDTGWRDVTSFLINGWTASYFHIRRVGDMVYIKFKGLNGTAATSTRFMDFSGAGIGSGFSPPDVMESGAYRNSSSSFTPYLTCSLSGGISTTANANFGTASARTWWWPCQATFPAVGSFPGTAA